MTLGQSLDEFPDFPDLTRVEAYRRLVEDQDVGFIHQGISKSDALAVSLGEGADELIANLSDAAEFQGILNLFGDAAGTDAFQGAPVAEVFSDAHLGVEGDVFGKVADPGTGFDRLAQDVEPRDLHLASICWKISAEDFHRRALPRTVRPQEADHLASIDREREIPDSIGRAVTFGESLDRDHTDAGKIGNLTATSRRCKNARAADIASLLHSTNLLKNGSSVPLLGQSSLSYRYDFSHLHEHILHGPLERGGHR